MNIMKQISMCLLIVCSSAFAQQPTRSDCEADNENLACCFIDMPKQLSHVVSIADTKEPGERLIVKGIVKKSDGKTPGSNVVLYAYHTNVEGIYPKKGNETGIRKWHGYLHSWGKTNERGEFEIRSIRPAQYPSRTAPAHIHIVVKEPNGSMYYVNDIMFADDVLVSNKKEDGVIVVEKNKDGVWSGFRTILLR